MSGYLPDPVDEVAFGFSVEPPAFLELAAAELNEEQTGLEDLTGTIQQAQEETAAAAASLSERDAEIADAAEWTRLTFEDTDPAFDEHLAGVDEASATLTDRVFSGIDELEKPPEPLPDPDLGDPAQTDSIAQSIAGLPGLGAWEEFVIAETRARVGELVASTIAAELPELLQPLSAAVEALRASDTALQAQIQALASQIGAAPPPEPEPEPEPVPVPGPEIEPPPPPPPPPPELIEFEL